MFFGLRRVEVRNFLFEEFLFLEKALLAVKIDS